MGFNPIEVVDKFAPEDMDTGPIAVLNLLKFKPGGEASYKRYIEECLASTDTVSPVGADIIYLGHFAELLQGDIGDWDFLNLVYYPNRRAMYEMIHSPDYQKVEHFRSDALEKALLYVTDAAMPFRSFTKGASVATPWAALGTAAAKV